MLPMIYLTYIPFVACLQSIKNVYIYIAGLRCKLPNVKNGAINTTDAYYYGDSLTVTCQKGFEVKGSASTVCGANHTFTNVPECTGKPLLV